MLSAPAPGLATGSIHSPELGLHVHATVRAGRLVAMRIAREPAEAPASAEAREVLGRVAAHLRTGREDLASIPVDLSGLAPFQRQVLEALRGVRAGTTVTYGGLARLVGNPAASRAVGAAMARNPIPIVVPCHRVVGSNGQVTSYSGEGGWDTKRRLLQIEGAWLF